MGKNKLIRIILVFLLILAFPVNIYLSNNWIDINIYNLSPDKLPAEFKGYTILQISDCHIKNDNDITRNIAFFKKAEEEILKDNKKIDCVVITGDLIDDASKMTTEAATFAGDIAKEYPVYYVGGNHDPHGALSYELQKNGVNVIDNKNEKLTRGDSEIWITGIGDLFQKNNDEDKAFKEVPIDDFAITLVHEPNAIKTLVEYGGDLILCGHTHGGQIRLPFLPAIYVPGQGVFPKYSYGFYEEQRLDMGQAFMYVNKGTGHSNILNFRFFNRPEIAIFILE